MTPEEEEAATLAIKAKVEKAVTIEDMADVLKMVVDLIYVRGKMEEHDKKLLDGVADAMRQMGSALQQLEAECNLLRTQMRVQ